MSSRRIERSKLRREAKQQTVIQREEPETGLNSLPSASRHSLLPLDILKLFISTFKDLFEREDLESLVQTVKGDLYNRDYSKAFSDDDRRMAYSVRWTPSRALAYASLFGSLDDVRDAICSNDAKVLSIGGGAGAELAALTSIFAQYKANTLNKGESNLNIELIDIADWSKNIDLITKGMKKSWIYDDPESLRIKFRFEDVLRTPSLDLKPLDLITILFTTNELFQEDRSLATKFLQSLSACKPGCLLLITESAGSYSHITIGTKRFPVQFLIDLILLGKENNGDWELVEESDSRWYRCGTGPDFDYPMKLENMRFFFRLYKRK